MTKKIFFTLIICFMMFSCGKKGDPVYEYELRSFFGTLGRRTPAENNYYITMRTKGKDDFGRRMSRGDYGPLD